MDENCNPYEYFLKLFRQIHIIHELAGEVSYGIFVHVRSKSDIERSAERPQKRLGA